MDPFDTSGEENSTGDLAPEPVSGSATSVLTQRLIGLLAHWPRKYITELLLAHPSPTDFVLSGELQSTLPGRWRRKARHDSGQSSASLGFLDEGFPESLKHIPDPPLVLYYQGDITLLANASIAVVGARRCTSQGRLNAKAVSADLVRRGISVTSGLALGIDGAAHRGALSVAGRGQTIAVLGAGLGRLYPQRHQALAEQILASGGLLLSEYPDQVQPRAFQFPERNRLISGLSAATVVVEAGLQSGSLITARYAAEQGRDVFAMPGPVNNAMSRGCHRLIQQGAGLVECAEDVLLGVGWDLDPVAGAQSSGAMGQASDVNTLSEVAQFVLAQLSGYAMTLDELQAVTSLQVADLTKTLVDMELRGFVQQGPLGYSRTS